MSCSGGLFDIESKQTELEKLRKQAESEDLWSDPDRARDLNRRIVHLSEPIEKWEKISRDFKDAEELFSLIEDEFSSDHDELMVEFERLEKEVLNWEFLKMMSGPDDRNDAILVIHPGAGGTESADWAGMLLRMYMRYVERRGYRSEVIDLQTSEQAGIKSASVEVNGEYAFGRLKAESGVHRLVRLSPFDASNRRHTSFASVYVYPVVEENDEIVINPSDLRIDTYRSSGAGGQHVNKTDSAVRITHLPTNTVATCQSERSQHRNREVALRFLKAKLLKNKRDEEAKKKDAVESGKSDIAWGSQIRNYVLHPYRMVKDLRTNTETSNTDAVLDGDLDQFIEPFLMETAGS